jgi:hypothetical protein
VNVVERLVALGVFDGRGYTMRMHHPDQARALAGVLLRAADEAEGLPDLSAALRSGAELGSHVAAQYTEIIKANERRRISAFIRANIDMKGLDFPDAEAVADWLEGK